MNERANSREQAAQLSLFGGAAPAGDARGAQPVAGTPGASSRVSDTSAKAQTTSRRAVVSPHLLAARRLSRQIRRLPEHSALETETGLAICRALKAYLDDQADRTH